MDYELKMMMEEIIFLLQDIKKALDKDKKPIKEESDPNQITIQEVCNE